MRLFTEKVNPIISNIDKNILQVESFEEIFFDVFEIKINNNKYLVEKISEYDNNPVVEIPITIGGEKALHKFILKQGKFKVFFNENSIPEDSYTDPNPVITEDVSEDIENFENSFEDELPILEYKKDELIKEIESAKAYAEKQVDEYNQLKLKELQVEQFEKEKKLQSLLDSSVQKMTEEFVSIVSKAKDDILKFTKNQQGEIKEALDLRIQDKVNNLENEIKQDFEKGSRLLESHIVNFVKEIYDTQVLKVVENRLSKISDDTNSTLSKIKESINQRIDKKVDSDNFEKVKTEIDSEIDSLRNESVNLNDSITKSGKESAKKIQSLNDKIFSKFDNVEKAVDKKIKESSSNIEKYFDNKISFVENNISELSDENRKYFIQLINESKQSLINEINAIKQKEAVEYIVENKSSPNKKVDILSIENKLETLIANKVANEISGLKRYMAFYGSGGGTVAQQFAAGGTMNGDLTVVGSISAYNYLGLNIPSGNYLPLSGGTITGNVNVVGDLSAKRISFDTAAGLTAGVGQLTWNATDSTLDLGINNDVTLQLGQEVLVQVKAEEALSNGQVVFASGTAGVGSANIAVSAYRANAAGPDEMYMLGVATQDFAKNEFGFVTTFGKVRDVVIANVQETGSPTWNIGTILYISATQRGRFTSIPPVAPDKSMPIAMVISNNGTKVTFFVRSEHGYHLNEIHDVATSNVQNNDILTYNSLSGVWTNSRNLVVDSLSANIINALSANITVIDIKQYELSGFNVQGNATVQGTISATGPIYSGGNQVATVVDPVRTTLTGNGVLSTFSISGANTLVNPSALIVAIDGALQEPVVDYTVLSGSITFTSPLPSGSKAVVISPTNSLQVSQMIPADGSVTSTKLDNSLTIAGTLVVNGQGPLSSLPVNAVMTNTLVDSNYQRCVNSVLTVDGPTIISNTTLTDTGLSAQLTQGVWYVEVLHIAVNTNTAAGGKGIGLIVSGSVTELMGGSNVSNGAYAKNASSTWFTAERSSSSAMLNATYVADGVLSVASATAVIKSQFAQGVSTAANTTLKGGSYIRATKIG